MKATEQYFPVVLFIILCKVVLTFIPWMKPSSVTIQINATEQHFPLALFIMLYKMVLTFETMAHHQAVLEC